VRLLINFIFRVYTIVSFCIPCQVEMHSTRGNATGKYPYLLSVALNVLNIQITIITHLPVPECLSDSYGHRGEKIVFLSLWEDIPQP
jgi:hypothetical protein